MVRLATLSEVPSNEEEITDSSRKVQKWRNWLRNHFFITKKSHLRILLSVLGCPLSPVSLLPNISISQVSSSAQYIIQHFTAATGCRKLEGGVVKNMYVSGKVSMAIVDHELGSTASGSPPAAGPSSSTSGVHEKGSFVLWQMVPNKWLIELAVGGQKIMAGSDGIVAWRHTPWLGAHAAKGGVRPLRRALQGLDPLLVSAVFSVAEYIGEKRILGIDCFVLKLSANNTDLAERSDNTAEMIKHVIFGYFSQRSGLLVYIEDSYLTRIQSPGSPPTYWETTMCTRIEDYQPVPEGVMIAHSGCSSVVITRFGDNLKTGLAVTRMEETYVIDDVAYNVPGLCADSFIPPDELQRGYPEENLDWKSPLHQ